MEAYASMWKAIIRPPRSNYELQDLGPTEFNIGAMNVARTDLEIVGHRNFKLQCSHFEPLESERQWDEMPCIIYMHGNSSSRVEAVDIAPFVLGANMTLFCFDFAGCGKSEGEFISLGWHERDDVNVIVNYLREHRKVNTIGLWGRSMGAATALLHSNRDHSIAGMVLDSAFADLRQLVGELARTHTKVPGFLVSTALSLIRGSVSSRADFDIYNLKPIDKLQESFIPALFATGEQDTFILPHHSKQMFEKYGGDKNFIKFEGDHNSPRPMFFYDSAVIFLMGTLQVEQLLTEHNKMSSEQKWQWVAKMKSRRDAQRQSNNAQEDALSLSKPNDVDMALGLDQDPDIQRGPAFLNTQPQVVGLGNRMMSEDEELQAAINASLMEQQKPPVQPNQPEQQNPQNDQEERKE